MLYRISASAIIFFWAIMTFLLVRSEFGADSGLRAIPVAQIARTIWLHEHSSDLTILSQGKRVGNVRVSPRVGNNDNNCLNILGFIQSDGAALQRFRVTFEIDVEMSPDFAMQTLQVVLRPQVSKGTPASENRFTIDFRTKHVKYVLRDQGESIDGEFTMDEAGMRKLLDQAGVSPMMLQAAAAQAGNTNFEFRSVRSKIQVRGEPLETVMVSMLVNKQVILDCHFSQTGELVSGHTPFGYDLKVDEPLP